MKFNFPSLNTKSIVGLDIGSSSIKAVELSRKGRGDNFELSHLGIAKVAPDEQQTIWENDNTRTCIDQLKPEGGDRTSRVSLSESFEDDGQAALDVRSGSKRIASGVISDSRSTSGP